MTISNNHNAFSNHLSSDELLKYHHGLFSPDEKNRIDIHMKECEFCSDALKGLSEMNDVMRIYNITHELRIRMKKRPSIRKKIFSGLDLLTIIMSLFILGIIILITFYFLYLKF